MKYLQLSIFVLQSLISLQSKVICKYIYLYLLRHNIFAMESRLYLYPKCEKDVKSISCQTRHANAFKMIISLQCYQLSNPNQVFNYNTTNPQDLPLITNKKSITTKVLNNNNLKKTRPANIDNNKKDIRSVDINKQKLATLKQTLQK